jgi:hypothetical protein
MEDPKKELARNDKQKIIRLKMKITISYQGILGSSGNFKNV